MKKLILDKISSPQDLRNLEIGELPQLAQEIREEILFTISQTGGHLASSLGAVELIIALHYCFNTPFDKIIFDVGHQAYAHKLLTGRREFFKTLRTLGGLSGFPKREESIYDNFNTGHASTAVSAALGIKVAKVLKEDDKNKVIAVIGDGSMTGGLCYEGLNQAGHLRKNLIVVLNDNQMAIAPNVGAISSLFNKRISASSYYRFRNEMKHILQTLSVTNFNLFKIVDKFRRSIKGLITPGIFFESLGFRYLGPIPGHQLEELILTFKNVQNQLTDHPLLIHVLTEKGKGYKFAQENPEIFHGTGPFKLETGEIEISSSRPSYSSIFGQTLIKLAEENPKIVAITAAMPEGTGLLDFAKLFPQRFFDVGIAEEHAVTFAAGLATEGLIPVVAIYSTFLQRAYDQILHDVALQNLPVIFVLDRSGIVGEDGPTHHGLFDLSYLRHIPNLILMAPKDENELQYMLQTAVLAKSPTVIRYPRGNSLGVNLESRLYPLEIGKAEIIFPERPELKEILKSEILIIAIGSMVYPSMVAARMLKKDGFKSMVINARFVKPLDEDLLLPLIAKIPLIVTVEENILAGGFGSAILEILEKEKISKNIVRLGIPDQFVPQGTQSQLREQYSLDPQSIYKRIFNELKEHVQKKIRPSISRERTYQIPSPRPGPYFRR